MGRCDLDAASAELFLHVIVGNDRDLTARKRKVKGLTHEMGIALIAGVHCYCRITEHGFWPRRGHLEMAIPTAERVAEMPEMAIHLFHLHLQVTHRGARSRTPIHQVFTAVDQALLMETNEGLFHRLAKTFIQREALSLPVDGIPQPAQLVNNATSTFCFPLPGALQEGLTAKVMARLALLLQLLLKDRLHCDRSVIRARQTKHVFARQPLIAHDRIDQSRIKGMPHVQAAGDVGRRDDHCKRFALSRRIRMKGPLVLPGLLPSGFRTNRVIGLGQIRHGENPYTPFMVAKDVFRRLDSDDQPASMPRIHGLHFQRSQHCHPADA